MRDGIVVTNEELDKMAEVKKSKREENKIREVGVEEKEIYTGEMDASKVEESCHLEDRK